MSLLYLLQLLAATREGYHVGISCTSDSHHHGMLQSALTMCSLHTFIYQCNSAILALAIYTICKITRKKMENRQITKFKTGKWVALCCCDNSTILIFTTYVLKYQLQSSHPEKWLCLLFHKSAPQHTIHVYSTHMM